MIGCPECKGGTVACNGSGICRGKKIIELIEVSYYVDAAVMAEPRRTVNPIHKETQRVQISPSTPLVSHE